MVAPGFLQNDDVRNWLGGIEPTWSLLDHQSFVSLAEPPSPTGGAIRLASDLESVCREREPIGATSIATID
jgi:hypothetical protein